MKGVVIYDADNRAIADIKVPMPPRQQREFEHDPAWCAMEGPSLPVVIPPGLVLAMDEQYRPHLFTENAWKALGDKS
jgi:hypothetical protein